MDDRPDGPTSGPAPRNPESEPSMPPAPGSGSMPPPASPPDPFGDTFAMQSPPAPPRRRPGLITALAIAGVLVIAGIAAGAVVYMLRGSPEKVASKLPADTTAAFAAYLDPSASQKVNLLRLAHRFPALSSDQRVGDTIDAALDDALGGTGLTSGDVESWVGAEVGLGVRFDGQAVEAVAVLDSGDDDAAQASLDKVRAARSELQWSSVGYHGVTVWTGRSGGTPSIVLALADNTVIAGSAVGLVNDVIDTATGDAPALADQAAYTAAVGRLPQGKLGFGYVDFEAITDRLGSAGTSIGGTGVTGTDPSAFRSAAMSLSAQPEGLVLDFTATLDPTKLSSAQRAALAASNDRHELLSWVPGDAYGVFAMSGLQRQIQSLVDQLPAEQAGSLERVGLTGPGGVLPHLTGEATIEVGPGAEYPSGALMLGGDDAAAMQRFLDRLGLLAAAAIQSQSSTPGSGSIPPTTVPPGGSVLAANEPFQLDPISDPMSPWQELSYRGVRIRFLSMDSLTGTGVEPAYAVSDGVGIIASSPDEIKRVLDARQGSSLPSDPAFARAVNSLGGADESLLYLDIAGIASAVRDALPPEERDAYDRNVAPNLKPIESFVMGSADDATTSSLRMVLLVT
jgi:uncharacterized protein DUF3352